MGTHTSETTLRPKLESQDAAERYYEHIPVGIVICDSKGRIIRMNQRNREIFGIIDPSMVYGFSVFDDHSILPEHREQMLICDDYTYSYDLNKDNLTLRGECHIDSVKQLMCRFRKIYDDEGTHVGYVLVNVDMTTMSIEMRSETQLLSKQLLQIQRSINMMTWRFDVRTGKVLVNYANAPEEYFSKNDSVRELSLTDFVRNIHPDDQHIFLEKFALVMQRKTDEISMEIRYNFSNSISGNYLWVAMSGTVSEVDAQDRVQLLVGSNVIIDRRKQMEAELRQAKEKAEASDKLKTAFIEQTNHEIRTPLNAIVGYADILASCHASLDEDSLQELVRGIRQNSDRMLNMVNSILYLSQLTSGSLKTQMSECSALDICNSVYARYKANTHEGVELRLEVNTEVPQIIRSDARLLTIVLSHLVDNAVKFTKEGHVSISYATRGNEVEFRVSDTGPGLPPQDLHVFDVFAKGDPFTPGLGLGLPLCRGIVSVLGSTLRTTTSPSTGTTFTFLVPSA